MLVIKAHLAHSVRDANGRAYNRTQYLVHRWTMMQAWADYLDRLRLRDHGGIEHKVVLRDLAMARELASRFRAGLVRVHVHGTWRRTVEGKWEAHQVYADCIEELDDLSAKEVFAEETGRADAQIPQRNTGKPGLF